MPSSGPLPVVTTFSSATTASATKNVPVQTPLPHRPSSIEAKLVILGSQGVGKTSLVNRFINPNAPLSVQSTVGASFVTKKIYDTDSNTTVRLQIWDTAGQERFRSISRLYYRGANAGILCYDVTDERSWEEMKGWLQEMRENCDFSFNEDKPGSGMVVHVVGTKIDLVADEPSRRQIPFERTIAYVAEHLAGVTFDQSQASTPPFPQRFGNAHAGTSIQSPDSKRSSGFWNSEVGWDSCHEVSSHDNDGIEEVFRVIARKLIDQRNKREAYEQTQTPWSAEGEGADYVSHRGPQQSNPRNAYGSFRLGHGHHRKSWLGLPGVTAGLGIGEHSDAVRNNSGGITGDPDEARRRGRCC